MAFSEPDLMLISFGRYSVFKGQDQYFAHPGFGGGYNTRDGEETIGENQTGNAQNIDISYDDTISKRKGHILHSKYLGNTTGILGLVNHEPPGGTNELLYAYDTDIYRDSTGLGLGVTLTTNKKIDYTYNPFTNKTYIVNGTDNVVKYTSGASADQTDGNFKKGKYIEYYKSRLIVANLSGGENQLWFTDLGVDTFSANNYLKAPQEITGIRVLFDKLLTFTKHQVYISINISFDAAANGTQLDQFTPLKTDFGAIYDRTIAKVGNLIYFIGQDPKGIAGVYVTDVVS